MPARIGLEPDFRDGLLQQVQDENAALHAANDRLRAENERLRGEGSAKDAQIKRQQAEIAALQARLGRPKKTPRNSSLPPSQAVKPNASGLPAATPAHPRRGHPGAHRPLCDNPTAVKDMRAGTCPHCAADLSGVEQSAGETYDHVEIPLAPAVITRVILRRGTCPCCRQAFIAEPPPGTEPGSPFGENLRARVVHLRQCHAVSYERLASVLDVQFGVRLSEGALAAILKAAAPAFAAQVAPIRRRLLAGTVIGSDETRFAWARPIGGCGCSRTPTVAASSSNRGATRMWSSASSAACGRASGSPTVWARRPAGAKSTKPAWRITPTSGLCRLSPASWPGRR
nr:transposase [Rhodopila globiformis]